jgi:hypothetical protein
MGAGCRGPTPTVADIQRRVEFDLWYIDNWNFRLDCLIVRPANGDRGSARSQCVLNLGGY